jgi:polysaccharide chain length determinant protein (PEP-CTERM system associated)
MLPGKKYKPEDVLQILRKRIWIILVPFAVVSAVTAVVARKLPDRYRSDTLILVVPQRVPEAYVKSTVTTRIEDRLQSISQQILSRTRLERIIQDFNLYAEERKTGIMEDIVQKMRTLEIKVDIIKGDAFRVSYIGSEPRTVMKVTERLASLFIEENLRDREVLAEGTNQFLEAQLEDARRRLMEHEKKLENYRNQFSGQLPSQLDSNMQVIQNTQLQIQAILESINRDRDRRLIVERQLGDLQAEAQATPLATLQPGFGEGVTGGSTAQQLAQARANLQALELRFKPGHPDLALWQRRVRDLEKKADAEALEAPVSAGSRPAPLSAVEAARNRRMGDLQAELDQLDRQITHKQEEEKRLRAVAAGYQARVDVAPARESEMAELTRDYATLQTMYTTLLSKKEDSKIAANLERRQIGEQFKLLDPARLPERPFSPDRRKINMMGIVAGLGIGFFLVGLLEYRDASFKTDEEVATVLQLPVLAVVPSMRSEAERRTIFRRKLVIGVGLGSTVTACLAVVVYTMVR